MIMKTTFLTNEDKNILDKEITDRVTKSEHESDINSLNNRISNIITNSDETGSNPELIDIRTAYDGSVYTTAGDAVRGQIGKLSKEIDGFIEIEVSPNLYNPINEGKYLHANGNLSSNAAYVTSDYIRVNGGDTVRYQFTLQDMGKRFDSTTHPGYDNIRFLCAYNADQVLVGTREEDISVYNVPDGVEYIRVTFPVKDFIVDRAILIADDATVQPYEPFGILRKTIKPEYIPMANTVVALAANGIVKKEENGANIAIEIPQLKNNTTISFYGTFDTFADLYIYQGKGTGYTESYCKITASHLEVYIHSFESPVLSVAHGLTMSDYISVVISRTLNTAAKVYIASGGGSFTSADTRWISSRDTISAEHGTASWNNILSWGSRDFLERVWMYGDSYFDHWLPVMIGRGYTAFLSDGYSGGTSANAYASFKRAISLGCPAKVIWCLGMNNPDNGAVNASWLECVTGVKAICDEKDIEFVVTTIPNVPERDHTYKNAYIRESFDYIDIAELVGSDESANWYAGLLSSDNVHPSVVGDFYIANLMTMHLPDLRRI